MEMRVGRRWARCWWVSAWRRGLFLVFESEGASMAKDDGREVDVCGRRTRGSTCFSSSECAWSVEGVESGVLGVKERSLLGLRERGVLRWRRTMGASSTCVVEGLAGRLASRVRNVRGASMGVASEVLGVAESVLLGLRGRRFFDGGGGWTRGRRVWSRDSRGDLLLEFGACVERRWA